VEPRSAVDGYHRFDDLLDIMKSMARDKPHLARVYSIGQTYEGRDLWMVEITDSETGPASSKPGYYIDGNHHAVEVAGSAVCLYTALYLLKHHGTDPEVTELLRSTSFYILPRVSADGAEMFLTTPYSLRSSTRPHPETEPAPGLHLEDVDGDGLILQMRVADPDGEWKVSDRDPRLMLRRGPDEWGGSYYRLYPEGVIHEWDGGEIRIAPSRWGLDLNRNYPFSREADSDAKVAGPYPLSEPESRAVADFFSTHPNLAGAMSYHTTGGYILRPSCHLPDEKLEAEDLRMMKSIGERGEALTGYPCVSTYEGFTGRRALTGVFMDWLYEDLGLLAYSTELWNAMARAGVRRQLGHLTSEEEEERGLKLLEWSDRELGSRGFVPWRRHHHPQLGPVELGGWDYKFTLWNPPPALLAGECHKNALFTLAHARSLPRVEVKETEVAALEKGVIHLVITLINRGYLPTWVASPGRNLPWVREPAARLDLPEGCQILHGSPTEKVGHLAGRAGASPDRSSGGREKRLTWVVSTSEAEGPVGKAQLTISGHRMGCLSVPVDLEVDR